MKKLKYILIRFKDDQFQCKGYQLKNILCILESFTKDFNWYVTDVLTNTGYVKDLPIDNLNFVGSTKKLKSIAANIEQFDSGIFIAASKTFNIDKYKLKRFDTDSDPEMHIPEALIEIRAFETTFFEIYTYDQSVIDKLMKEFDLTEKDFGHVDN